MKILLLEDDVRLASLISRGLRRDGHAVDQAGTIEDARWFAAEGMYDVLVLDVMLPDGDGFGLCAALRAEGNWTPVLMLTARDAISDRVRGLDVGADDYLTKPFALAELQARLRALTRRGPTDRPIALSSGALTLEPATRRVAVDGRHVPLVGREFALLEYFMRHQDEVLTRARIIDEVWDWAFDGTPRIIDVYVAALRAHLGSAPNVPRLETVRGVGYVLRPARGRATAPSTSRGPHVANESIG